MPKDELFVVRTSHLVGGLFQHRTTLARSREEAVRQAERIGTLDEREEVRSFLEGRHRMHGGQAVFTTLGAVGAWTGVATVYRLEAE